MGRPFKCPYCGATESVSKGVRKTKMMGDRRIRRCKKCRRKFTPKSQRPLLPTREEVAQPAPQAEAPAGPSEAVVQPPQPG
jgi:transposase-like protein